MSSTILVLSPHPDDECLGCGGALCRHALRGEQIHVHFLTSGGLRTYTPGVTRPAREAEARHAAKMLGVYAVAFWREPDGELRPRASLARRLVRTIRKLNPRIIYAPHADDAHADHRATCQLLLTALDEVGRPRPTVRLYEVWTPIQNVNRAVDVTQVIGTKLAAMQAYESQSRTRPFAEALIGLNRYRGVMHSRKTDGFAEAFIELH